MDEIEQFWRRADEAQELMQRGMAIYPQKRPDQLGLKKRREAGDPNVKIWRHDEDDIEYRLEFTDGQRAVLERAYLEAQKASGVPKSYDNREARLFVRLIEDWPGYLLQLQASEPNSQKERGRALDAVGNAITKLDQSLAALDSAALGYWYAHVADALARSGFQLSEADNQMTSMIKHPMRAMVEGGETRKELRAMVEVVVKATMEAKDSLPKFERVEQDPRMVQARQLEDLLGRHKITFDTSETGFPAKCLRTIFDIAGVEVEKVSYWLKKAEEHPDSWAKFAKKIADRL